MVNWLVNGIHGFWKVESQNSRPRDYSLWVGQGDLCGKAQQADLDAVAAAHVASLISCFRVEKDDLAFPEDQKIQFNESEGLTVSVYPRFPPKLCQLRLMVKLQRQMKKIHQMMLIFW